MLLIQKDAKFRGIRSTSVCSFGATNVTEFHGMAKWKHYRSVSVIGYHLPLISKYLSLDIYIQIYFIYS